MISCLLEPDSAAFNVGGYADIDGFVDVAVFRSAVAFAVAQTDALRIKLIKDGDGYAQLLRNDVDNRIEMIDFRDHADADWAARKFLRSEIDRPIGVLDDHLFSTYLLQTRKDRFTFVFRCHHVCMDGASVFSFVKSLSEAYTHLARTLELPPSLFDRLSPLLDQEDAYRASQRFDRDRTFWRDYLADTLDGGALASKPQGIVRGFREVVRIGPELEGLLANVAQRGRASFSAVALASVAIHLALRRGERSVLLSLVVSGRSKRDARVPGMLSNIVPLRVDVPLDASFEQIVHGVARELATVVRHHRYRLEDMREDHPAWRRSGGLPGPLVNVMQFDIELDFAGSPAVSRSIANGPVDDLSFLFCKRGPGLDFELFIDVNPGVWDEAAHLAHRRSYVALLEGLASDPTGPVWRFAERGTMPGGAPRGVNETGKAEAGMALHTLVERQVRATPDAVALVFRGESLCLAEVNRRANRLAHLLIGYGIGPESIVAVALPRSIDLVVSLLGVVKTGAAYLPLDPDQPSERLRLMVDDARPRHLITTITLGNRIGAGLARSEVDGLTFRHGLATAADTDPTDAERRGRVLGDTPAYVIYTSGSTGRPKGVVVGHAAIVNRLTWMQSAYGLTPADRVLQKTSASFDVSLWEFFWPLIAGAGLVIAEPGGHRDPGYLVDLIRAEGVTTVHFVPSALQHFMLHPRAKSCTGLRHVVCSGEALSPQHRDQFFTLFDARLSNLYGPTEAAVDVTAWDCGMDRRAPTIPIGTPIANTAVRVLSGDLLPVPLGLRGELFLAGAGLARGYLGRPGLTAERFLPDPLGPPGTRMYRTGDVVHWDGDDQLVYVGRRDDQVKVRGFRVEPREVEAALAGSPSIGQAVVVLRRDPHGDARLIGYVTPVAGGLVEPESLRADLARVLPEHMVPSAILVLPAMPLGPNGKLDRSQLPDPSFAVSRPRATRSPREAILASFFEDLLGLAEVGSQDSFFDLGGHSLLAMRLAGRIGAAFGVELSVRAIFENPTVAGLLAVLDSARVARPPVASAPRPAVLPLSSAQRRLWFLHRLHGANRAYNMPVALDMRGRLDTAALARALDDLVARHEILRTLYAERDGAAEQRILPAAEFPLAREDLRSEALAEALVRLASPGFEIERDPPIRATLLRLAPDHHVLLLVLHHIAADGWSFGPLARDLECAYAARLGDAVPHWAPLPVQYVDHALWERDRIAEETEAHGLFAAQMRHWIARLADAPEQIDLPTARPRPARPSHAGGSAAFSLDAGLHAGLKAIAAEENATLFMVLLASFAAALARSGAGTDVVVGTPVAGRGDAALDGLIGFFVNMLALRIDLSGRPSLRALLRRARDVALDAYANSDVPFDRVVERLNPNRSQARHPIFQVVLALQNTGDVALSMPELAVTPLPVELSAHKFDLTISLAERRSEDGAPGGLSGTVEFAIDILDGAGVERLVARFRRILEAMATRPDAVVEAVDVLGLEERKQILEGWNSARRGSAPDTVAAMFERCVARDPHATAVEIDDDALSYAELDAWADRIAGSLAARGVGPERIVAVALPRGPALIAGLLGVMKVGAAYLPLDVDYPPQRLTWMIEDARPACLLADATFAQVFGEGLDLLDDRAVTELRHGGAAQGKGPPCAAASNAAYVIYTSGSTGRPKGVVVSHRGVASLVQSQVERLGVTPASRVLQFASISFDAAFFEMCMALLTGAKLVLAPRTRSLLDQLPAFMRRHGVTHATLPPSLLARMSPGELDGCRWLILAGEALPRQLVRDWSARHAIVNAYGPTETTVWATASDPLAEDGAPPPIGRPIIGTRTYILDADLAPVPCGVTGELYIAGEGLARGYLGRPGTTAEAFVPDPFQAHGSRMYRTGDRARHREDGQIEFLGRLDKQVKLRGVRIELEEVAEGIRRQPGIRDALALIWDPGPGRPAELVAYAVGASGTDRATLLASLRAELPDTMVPTQLFLLDALPITPNGKVDVSALPTSGDVFDLVDDASPGSDAERAVAEIWRKVLRTGPLGRASDFFALGGHSLSAMQVVSRVREAQRVDVPLRALFEAPRLEDFALIVERAAPLDAPGGEVPAPRPDRLPPSHAQQRLWFLEQIDGATAAYTIGGAFRLRGELDIEALVASFDDLIRRHESLRTTFGSDSGRPYLRFGFAASPVLTVTDLRHHVGASKQGALAAFLRDDATRPFDLGVGPLLRASLAVLGTGEHVLAIAMHHIVSDGWSVSILLGEVGALYAARVAGREPNLPPAPQHVDHVLEQAAALETGAGERGLAFWRQALRGAPETSGIPTDRARPARQTFAGSTVCFSADADLSAAVNGLARREGATLFMVLLAAFDAVLTRWSGEGDTVVGTPVANRARPALAGVIGLLVDTVVIRADLGGDPSFRTALSRVREAALTAFTHADYPFDVLVDKLQPTRDLSRHPIFQTMFILQNAPAPALDLIGIEAVPIEDGAACTAKFDLTLSAVEAKGAIHFTLEFATDLFDRSTIERLATHVVNALSAVAADPEIPLSRLPLVGADEAAEIAMQAGSVDERASVHCAVHHFIDDIASASPDRVALIADHRSLTYGDLVRQAEAACRRLQAEGVGPGAVVGLYAGRSIEAVVGILAVLKAGGAYLPLDVDGPEERVRAVLRDAAAHCLLAVPELAARAASVWNGAVARLDLDGGADDGRRGPPAPAVNGLDLAYVIYTSGSTGRPKGVMATHHGLLNRIVAQRRIAPFRPDDVCCHKTSLVFVDAVFEILGPLCSGLPLVITGDNEGRDADALARKLHRHKVTRLIAVPSLVAALLDAAGGDDRLDGVRDWTLSGETLSPELLSRLRTRYPEAGIVNLYGSAEVAADATAFVASEADAGVVPIGRPLPNTTAHILDASLRPVPIGVAGELYVGGLGVARGYLGDARHTAERFLPDPFRPGERFFRTGDLARWRPGGLIEFLGRSDRQVKVMGHRVELDEVEAALLGHVSVLAVAVVALERGDKGEPEIAAFVVPRRGAAPHAAELRSALRKKLPAAMVPTRIAIVDALPRTPSGKIDRRAAARLPIPAKEPVSNVAATPTESAVAEIWSELLGLDGVDVTVNFFEAGGNSLLVMRMQHLIRQRLGRLLPVADLFQHSTIRALSQHLSADGDGARARAAPAPTGAMPRDRLAALRSRQRTTATR